MAAIESLEIPVGMWKVCRRFECWREGHKARLALPEALWTGYITTSRPSRPYANLIDSGRNV